MHPSAGLSAVTWLVTLTQLTSAFWQDDLMAIRHIKLDERDVLRFSGNTSHKDHFKLLEKDGNSLLIGARNLVFNISLVDFTEHRQERIEWYSDRRDVNLCTIKGLDEEACHNYIRVLAKQEDGSLFVCGTNSYNPKCRTYKKSELGYIADGRDEDGKGKCPYNPNHNSTITFVDGQLYAGTVADFAGSDPLVYRHPLRTEQYELKQLNAPNFVGSLAHEDYVYFFFRETAVEYINCGKRVYSRVARVCKNDRGGSYKYRHKWTSFLKSRLNCSIPGEYPFYFDEIQSISSVQRGRDGEEVLYAVFTTPSNSIAGSAVCAFSMSDVRKAFDGPFKHQQEMNSNWLPLKTSLVPEPRPGACQNDSRTLSDVHFNFIRTHPLMDDAVPSLHGRPLLVRTSLRQRFTKIAVDPQVMAADGIAYDVIYIATDDGRVLKAINSAAGAAHHLADPVIVEEIHAFPSRGSITNLLVSREAGQPPRLIVVTDAEIRAFPLHRCRQVSRCASCVRMQDPYCAWQPQMRKCVALDEPAAWSEDVQRVQNVSSGEHSYCPQKHDRDPKTLFHDVTTSRPSSTLAPPPPPPPCDCSGEAASGPGPLDPVPNIEDNLLADYSDEVLERDIYESTEGGQRVLDIVERAKAYPAAAATESRRMEPDGVYSAETLAVAVVTTCFLALLVGFVAGWLFSRRHCRLRGEPYYETPHLDRQNKMKQMEAASAVPAKPDNRCERNFSTPDAGYLVNNGKQINLVVNQTKNSNGKNANSAADIKPLQKVRKMYL